MATYTEQLKDLRDQKLQAWEAAKEVLDHASVQKRRLTAEEDAQYRRATDDMDSLDKRITAIMDAEKSAGRMGGMREEFDRIARPYGSEGSESERRQVADFFSPHGTRSHLDLDLRPAHAASQAWRQGARGSEFRGLFSDSVASSGGSLLIPTEMASTLYEYLTGSCAMRRTRATIVTAERGGVYDIPKVGTHGVGTQIATQNTALAGTDPIFAKTSLSTYDYGQIIAVGNDFVEDSGVDIAGFVASNIGRALGEVTGKDYVVGSGSGQPQGVVTAITGAGTIATGGSLLGPTVEKMVDLQYSVADKYRSRGGEWLANDLTLATLRKLRDGAGGTIGAFLWQPSQVVGAPATFLGDAIFAETNVASIASNAAVCVYGDLSAYWIRDVAPTVRIERSTDLLFDKAQTAWRGIIRTGGALVDTRAVNFMKCSVS